MVIGIIIGSIFVGFFLGFATMAFVSARNNRLQSEEAQETTSHFICAASPTRRVTHLLPAIPQASGESCLLAPGS
jgi:hypothetical protein